MLSSLSHYLTVIRNQPITNAIIPFITIIIVGIATGVIATARGSELLGLFVIALGTIAIMFILSMLDDPQLKYIMLLAFLLRLGLVFVHAYIMPLPDSSADAITFERLGWQASEAWLGRGAEPSLSGAYLYSAWIGFLYLFFGRLPILAQFANVLLGTFAVYITWKLAFLITESRRPSLITGWLMALFPTLNLYSAILLRESFIVIFMVISVYCFVMWLKSGGLNRMVGALIFLLAATSLHVGIVFIGLVYALFFIFSHLKRKSRTLFSVDIIVIIILIIVTMVCIREILGIKLSMSLILSPDYLSKHTIVAARDRAAYLTGLAPGSIIDIVLQTPVRMLYFLYTPFPWMVSSLVDLIGHADAILYIFLSIYAVKGLIWLWDEDKALFWSVVLLLIVFVGSFAWGTSNYGTAIRHRQKIVWLLIIPSAIGLAQSPWWRWLYPVKKIPLNRDVGGKVLERFSRNNMY